MKSLVMFAAMFLTLAACTESDPADKFVGNWTQVNTRGMAPITAAISRQGGGFQIDLSMPVPNNAPVKISKAGRFQDGGLSADGIEKISIVDASGHLMIGANEFDKAK